MEIIGRIPVSGEFTKYEGHKDKSSQIHLVPTGGVLRKDKKRSRQKAWHELIALNAWHRLLDQHNKTTQDKGLHVISPAPYGLDSQSRIYMEFIPGISADSSLPGNYDKGGVKTLSKREIRDDFAKRLGRILRIKDIENLAHYDFQLRHLVHDINNGLLAVIDVENSKIDQEQTKAEHEAIINQLGSAFSQSQKVQKQIKEAISEGYESEIDDYSILGDITTDLLKEGVFHQKQLEKFLQK